MGIVFQNYALFDNMTVSRNVSYALKFHGVDAAEADKKSAQMLELVGLKNFADKMPAQLSGGQQQRVAIARARALEPEIILFDEPLAALDALTRFDIRRELKNLQQTLGTTMIYVTHDQEEAFALSDKIMIMERGDDVYRGTIRAARLFVHANNAGRFGASRSLPAIFGGSVMYAIAFLADLLNPPLKQNDYAKNISIAEKTSRADKIIFGFCAGLSLLIIAPLVTFCVMTFAAKYPVD